jgi:transposase
LIFLRSSRLPFFLLHDDIPPKSDRTDPTTLADLAKGRLREKVDKLEQALEGRVRDVHRFMLADALAQIDFYDERLARISHQIEELLRPFDQHIANLDSIPGVGQQVAQVILAEVGADMSRFPTDGHLAAWAGVAPGNNQSGGKRLSGAVRKGSPALRRALVQAAHAASKTKQTYLSAQYHRLALRRGRKRYLGGCSLHLSHCLSYSSAWHHLPRVRT